MNQESKTLQDVLMHSFSQYRDDLAICVVDGERLTYDDVKKQVENQLFRLAQLGIESGDKVAIVGANSLNWVVAYFSILARGAVAVPVLPDFAAWEIENVLLHSESKIAFVAEKMMPQITDKAREEVKIFVSLDNMGQFTPEAGTKKMPKVEAFDAEGCLAVNHYPVHEDDLASIIYTSGTTGNSKGVMLTHKNLVTNVKQCALIEPLEKGDVFLSILPLSHTLENTVGLLLPIAFGAAINYLDKPPTASVLVPALQKVRPTYLLSVPMVIEKIYKLQIKAKFNKSAVIRRLYRLPMIRKILNRIAGKKLYETFGGRMKFFGIGGAKLDASTERFLREAKFPYAIGYGLTETAPLVAGDGVKYTRFQSTGRPVSTVKLKIHEPDPETGEGEIWVQGDNVMQGYYKEPDMTSQVLTPDRWFKTGDLGLLDKENFLYIKGRSKNVIVGPSGENIYPEEIEAVVNRFSHVLESVVVERDGKLVALVHFNIEELESQFKHFKEEAKKKAEAKAQELVLELRDYVNQRVNKFSQIQAAAVQWDAFEKTATKKIKRYLYK